MSHEWNGSGDEGFNGLADDETVYQPAEWKVAYPVVSPETARRILVRDAPVMPDIEEEFPEPFEVLHFVTPNGDRVTIPIAPMGSNQLPTGQRTLRLGRVECTMASRNLVNSPL